MAMRRMSVLTEKIVLMLGVIVVTSGWLSPMKNIMLRYDTTSVLRLIVERGNLEGMLFLVAMSNRVSNPPSTTNTENTENCATLTEGLPFSIKPQIADE